MTFFRRLFPRPVLPIDRPALPAPVEHFYITVDRDAQADHARVQTLRERGLLSYEQAKLECRAVFERHVNKVIEDVVKGGAK